MTCYGFARMIHTFSRADADARLVREFSPSRSSSALIRFSGAAAECDDPARPRQPITPSFAEISALDFADQAGTIDADGLAPANGPVR